MHDIRWFTVAALLVLAVATYMNWYFVWGLLFVYWGLHAVVSGSAFVVETIDRDPHPILFWVICTLWTGLGLWAIYIDLVWRFQV